MSDRTDTIERQTTWPTDADHLAAFEAVERNLREDYAVQSIDTCYASRNEDGWFVTIEAIVEPEGR